MLYSDFLKQQQAALDKRFSGNANMVKVKDSRFQSGYGWMPKGMADGTNHTKYYNAAQAWRAGGRVGKYTPPNLAAGKTQGRIGSSRTGRISGSRAAQERRRKAAAALKAKRMKDQADALAQRQAAAQQAAQQRQQRQQRMAQQGRNIGNFVHRGGTSPSPSQSYYRPPSMGMAPGASMFQQAMLRGFRPPSQDTARAARQMFPRMSAAGRRQRSGDVNSPSAYFNNRFQRTGFPSYSRRGARG